MKIDTAYIPCAGQGSRVRPFTTYFPKEILPVGGIPLLGYALAECKEIGVTRVGLILNHRKMLLHDFAKSWAIEKSWKVKIEIIEQKAPKGVGDALLLLKKRAPKAFYWMMPDNVYSGNPLRLLRNHFRLEEGCIGLLQKMKGKEKALYGYSGRMKVRENKKKVQILSVEVKKKGSFEQVKGSVIRGSGRGILTHDIFPCLETTKVEGKEFDDAPAYNLLAEKGKLYGIFWKNQVFDCGRWTGFLKANDLFFQNRIKEKG